MKGGAQLSEGPPRRGQLMRDFVLASATGERVSLSDYRGKKNLVVVFTGHERLLLLQQLAAQQNELSNEQAQVLVVLLGEISDLHLPFAVVGDADGTVHAAVGAAADAPALYITDRFGEVFAAFRTAEGKALPSAAEVLDWLDFVNQQCEECFPPEWPAA